MKNCDLGLENAALGLRPRAAFSRPRSQFFTIRTSQPANNIYVFDSMSGSQWTQKSWTSASYTIVKFVLHVQHVTSVKGIFSKFQRRLSRGKFVGNWACTCAKRRTCSYLQTFLKETDTSSNHRLESAGLNALEEILFKMSGMGRLREDSNA